MSRALVVRSTAAAALAAVGAMLVLGVGGAGAAGTLVAYNVYPLVSDSSAVSAPLTDASLVNSWGLSATATSPWWTSNNKTNTSTLYSGVGSKVALTVTVPGGPTGTVASASATDFPVSQGGASGASRFLFDTEAGTILGWTPTVNGTAAVVAVDNSAKGAHYTGLATANDRLYAADFKNARVDAYDANWQPLPLGFSDPNIPKGWAPFGIQAAGTSIFVTYAQQDKDKEDAVAGGGLGYVDEFTPDGKLVGRVASKGNSRAPLNAPWGLAMAPANFGAFSGDLLVGNFGNGRISAYLKQSDGKWVYKGQLAKATGEPIVLDGLWAIAFGNGAAAGPTTNLYFLAGPTGETHGLYGFIGAG
jgi:uncharacterized protein (TIGR03118 family)